MFWVDSFAIPANAPNIANAHAFINYLLQPEVAKANTEYTGYATPNRAALELLAPEVRDDPTVFAPKAALAAGEFHTDIGDEAIALMNDYWQKLKTAQ